MTNIILDCGNFSERVSAWLDNEMDASTAAGMERHATNCATCRTLAADVRAIRERAASLPLLAPSRDLWAGIETRIAAPVIPIGARAFGSDAPVRAESPRRRSWLRPAMAAAALVIVTAGLTHVLESRRATGTASAARPATLASSQTPRPEVQPRDTVAAPAPAPAASASSASPAPVAAPGRPVQLLASNEGAASAPASEAYRLTGKLAASNVEASYNGEITRLRAIVDHNRGQLDSSTVRVLEHNLQVIDSAIVQCQRALQRDPGSRFLIESLDNALRSKVELLRTTATMSS